MISSAIQNAARQAGRNPAEITLVAASKKTEISQIEAALHWGLRTFGENRVQEGIAKFFDSGLIHQIDALHFIGPLQSNKVNKVVGAFDLIHSLDSLPLAKKIEKTAARLSIIQSVLIEVNIADEESKHGVSVAETTDLVHAVRTLPHLSLLGLMAIPPASSDPEKARPYFAALRQLGNRLGLYRFSMGMSSDFEVAISEGATWVRIGSAIFGERSH